MANVRTTHAQTKCLHLCFAQSDSICTVGMLAVLAFVFAAWLSVLLKRNLSRVLSSVQVHKMDGGARRKF